MRASPVQVPEQARTLAQPRVTCTTARPPTGHSGAAAYSTREQGLSGRLQKHSPRFTRQPRVRDVPSTRHVRLSHPQHPSCRNAAYRTIPFTLHEQIHAHHVVEPEVQLIKGKVLLGLVRSLPSGVLHAKRSDVRHHHTRYQGYSATPQHQATLTTAALCKQQMHVPRVRLGTCKSRNPRARYTAIRATEDPGFLSLPL